MQFHLFRLYLCKMTVLAGFVDHQMITFTDSTFTGQVFIYSSSC
jgi:hypothetical protein